MSKSFGYYVYKHLFDYYQNICLEGEQDCVVFILGSEGSGKSSLALSILRYFWDNFYSHIGIADSFHQLLSECIVHSEADLERWYGAYGDDKYFPLWIDEGTIIDKRQGMKDVVIRFTKYLQRCRERQKLILICNPIDVDKRVCRYRYTYFITLIKTKDPTSKFLRRYGLFIGRKVGSLTENAIDMLIRLYTSTLFHNMVAGLFPLIDTVYKKFEREFDNYLDQLREEGDLGKYLLTSIAKEVYGVKKLKGLIDLLLGGSFSTYYISGLLQVYRNLEYHGDFIADDLIFSKEDYKEYLKVKREKFSLWVKSECSSYVYYSEFIPKVINEILTALIHKRFDVYSLEGVDELLPKVKDRVDEFIRIISRIANDNTSDLCQVVNEDYCEYLAAYLKAYRTVNSAMLGPLSERKIQCSNLLRKIDNFLKERGLLGNRLLDVISAYGRKSFYIDDNTLKNYIKKCIDNLKPDRPIRFISFYGDEKAFAETILEDYEKIGGKTKIKAEDIFKTLYMYSKIDMERFIIYVDRKRRKIEIVVKKDIDTASYPVKHISYDELKVMTFYGDASIEDVIADEIVKAIAPMHNLPIFPVRIYELKKVLVDYGKALKEFFEKNSDI